MKRLFLGFFLLFGTHFMLAQHSSNAYLEQADSLYSHHNYNAAAEIYLKALKKSEKQANVMLKLALCYSKMNNLTQAEEWFVKAQEHDATFSHENTYNFVNVYVKQNKRKKAAELLEDLIQRDGSLLYAKQLLDDIQNYTKFYHDTTIFKVRPLSINSTVAEFAPEFYKEGIVFSSAQPEKGNKETYHWDGSHYLNIYYSKKIDKEKFEKPSIFDKSLNTRFHDGPVSFYNQDRNMIINRNKPLKVTKKENTWIWHLTLYEASKAAGNNEWLINLLPFDEPHYSFAHPSISENGTVLYFISDIPGGYGGMDIYRVERKGGGRWSKPFNLGPPINTPGNEVFPFYINNTLYFSSDRHGGLGGLDIFKSIQTPNGFSPPENLGYPINTHTDDFSFITYPNQKSGYFASGRSGNDDLYTFWTEEDVNFLAHIYDGKTIDPLINADIQVITSTDEDLSIRSDSTGHFKFKVPENTPYIIVGTHEGKSGMLSGTASADLDEKHYTHQLPVFGDTTKIPCIAYIKNEYGDEQTAAFLYVTDVKEGTTLGNERDMAMISFLGERGHTYRVEAQNIYGESGVKEVTIDQEDQGTKKIELILTHSQPLIAMAGQTLKALDSQPIPNADVKIITYIEEDQVATSDSDGIVEFSIPQGAAYMVIGEKNGLVGMHSGVATINTNKNQVTHPIHLHSQSDGAIPVLTVVTNTDGDIIPDYDIQILEKGLSAPLESFSNAGTTSFLGQQGKTYEITVKHKEYQTSIEEVILSQGIDNIEKYSVVLEKTSGSEPGVVIFKMAARVFNHKNQAPLANATVKVITLLHPDLELIADKNGEVFFELEEGTPFVLIGQKENFTGMNSGIASKESSKLFLTIPIAAKTDPKNQVGVVGKILDSEGNPVTQGKIIVRDEPYGTQIAHDNHKGMINFLGEKGKSYTISVEHLNHEPLIEKINIPTDTQTEEKFSISLEKLKPQVNVNVNAPKVYEMAGIVFKNENKEPLGGAEVVLITMVEPDSTLFADENGKFIFTLTDGAPFVLIASKDEYIGMTSSTSTLATSKVYFTHQIAAKTDPPNALSVVGKITDNQGQNLKVASVYIEDVASGREIPALFSDGMLSFIGEKGKSYNLQVDHTGYKSAQKTITLPKEGSMKGHLHIVMENISPKPAEDVRQDPEPMISHVPVTATLTNNDGQPVTDAEVTVINKATGKSIPAKIEKGQIVFDGEKGQLYQIDVIHNHYHPSSEEITIPVQGSELSSSIRLSKKTTPSESSTIPINTRIADEDNNPLEGAHAIVYHKATDEEIPVQWKEGHLQFEGKKGESYSLIVTHEGYAPASKIIEIPKQANSLDELNLTLEKLVVEEVPEDLLPAYATVVATIANHDGELLTPTNITVVDTDTGEEIPVKLNNGILQFFGKKNSTYAISANHENYIPETEEIIVSDQDGAFNQVAIILERKEIQKTNLISNHIPVRTAIKNEDGDPVTDAIISLKNKITNEMIANTYQDGTISFDGEKGNRYSLEISKENFDPVVKDILIPMDAKEMAPLEITLHKKIAPKKESKKSVPVATDLNIIASIITPQGEPFTNASISIIDKESGEEIPVQLENGVIAFVGKKGNAYTVSINHPDYQSLSEVISIPSDASQLPPIQFQLKNRDTENIQAIKHLSVKANLKDDQGQPLKDADIQLTDHSGKTIPAHYENGVITFDGEKGKTYSLTVDHSNFEKAHKSIEIPEGKEMSPVDITLVKSTLATDDNRSSDETHSFVTVKVFDKNGELATQESTVKVYDNSIDESIPADWKNGEITFEGEHGKDYTILVIQDGYLPASQKVSVPLGSAEDPQVTLQKIEVEKVPEELKATHASVVAIVADHEGNLLTNASIIVTDLDSNEEISVERKNGIVQFFGKKNTAYSIQTSHVGFISSTEEIAIPETEKGFNQIAIILDKEKDEGITYNSDQPSSEIQKQSIQSTLIILNDNREAGKAYLASNNSVFEITEAEGSLTMHGKGETRDLGNYTLMELRDNFNSILPQWGINADEVITVNNIYFDYGKSKLDDEDRNELNKVTQILKRYTDIQLTIGAHADDRGSDGFNLKLSKKRAKAAESYLIKKGVGDHKIFIEPYGESRPAVPCQTPECTEEEYQKNRRAEFGFTIDYQVPPPVLALQSAEKEVESETKPVTPVKSHTYSYQEILSKYGDKTLEGLSFKITIGAYRYNHDLTFPQLEDLGTVESVKPNDITYYYLGSYTTLREAESVRQQVMQRGPKDALVSISYNGKKIKFGAYIALFK